MKIKKFNAKSGWSFFWFVLIFGFILSLIGITAGIGASIRIPSTNVNFSLGGSIGKKEVVPRVLPSYLRNQIGDNSTFFNHSQTLTLWIAEGIGIVVLGNQPQAPLADLKINVTR